MRSGTSGQSRMDRAAAKRLQRHFHGCSRLKNRTNGHIGQSSQPGRDQIMSSEELPPRESMEFDVVIVGAGPSGLVGRDPAEAAQCRSHHRRGGEGLRGRRAHPVGRGDRSGLARQAGSRLARGRRLPAEDAGQGRQVLLDDRGQRDPAAGLRDAAADEQSSLLYRLARQCLPLAGAQGRGARGRDLSGLCGGRSALRRQGRGARHRHRRHGRRQGRLAQIVLHPRHGAPRQIHAVRRRRARQPHQAADREICARRQHRSRRNSASG